MCNNEFVVRWSGEGHCMSWHVCGKFTIFLGYTTKGIKIYIINSEYTFILDYDRLSLSCKRCVSLLQTKICRHVDFGWSSRWRMLVTQWVVLRDVTMWVMEMGMGPRHTHTHTYTYTHKHTSHLLIGQWYPSPHISQWHYSLIISPFSVVWIDMANGNGFGHFIVHMSRSVAFKQVIVVIAGVCPFYTKLFALHSAIEVSERRLLSWSHVGVSSFFTSWTWQELSFHTYLLMRSEYDHHKAILGS
jgi:hypothetical protein